MAAEFKQVSLFPGFEVSSDDIFLDVGCGGGENCRSAASVGCDVIALDILPEYVGAAKWACGGMGARSFRGIVTDCDPIPLPDNSASAILCFEVMEHVEDPVKFLKELVRVGKPGARYALSVPAAPAESLMKVVAPASYFAPPEHLRIFERDQFEKLIQSSGLEIDCSEGLGFYWSIWWTLRMASGAEFNPGMTSPAPPILQAWEDTWKALESTPLGPQVSQAFDKLIPKSIRVVAHKPLAVPKPHISLVKRALSKTSKKLGLGR
jgi:SAM-dependent methyltransferase